MASGDKVLLAEIGAPHGVRGEVRVKSFAETPDTLGVYGALHDEAGRRYTVTSARPAKGVVIVRFAEIASREEAEAAKHRRLYIDRSALPDPDEDEFYLVDLIGLRAELEDGTVYGEVATVQDFGAGDIIEVKRADGTLEMFAFTRETVPVVDIAGGRIVIRPPASVEARGDDRPAEDPGT